MFAQTISIDESYEFLNQIIDNWGTSSDSADYFIKDKAEVVNIMAYDITISTDSTFFKKNKKEFPSSPFTPFTKLDSLEITKQLVNTNFDTSFLNAQYLHHARLISSQKLEEVFKKDDWWSYIHHKPGAVSAWKYIHDKMGVINGYHSLSRPIFFDNGNKAIFSHSYSCGELCGHGDISVYYRINTKWTMVATFITWIN